MSKNNKEHDRKYQKEKRKKWKNNPSLYWYQIEKEKERIRARRHKPGRIFGEYKRDAKRRNRNFELTKEQFIQYWEKPCYYCGDKVKFIGLDRIDNERGYTINNIVSCCWECNRMKKNYSQKEFLDKCVKIAKNLLAREREVIASPMELNAP